MFSVLAFQNNYCVLPDVQKTVDCMTTMSVPSTLVKCLYLFFDLPHMAEAPVGPTPPPPPPPTATQEKTAGQGHNQQELPLADRRVLLQKVFVQVNGQRVYFRICPLQIAQPPFLSLLTNRLKHS